jgi:signal transduction histidine kinase
MSISFIGIITVQVLWIKNAIEIKKEQFSTNVKQALKRTSIEISELEFNAYVHSFKLIIDSIPKTDRREIASYYIETTNLNNSKIIYTNSAFENQINAIPKLFNEKIDTIRLKNVEISRGTYEYRKRLDPNGKRFTLEHSNEILSQVDDFMKAQFETIISDKATKTPINQRTSIDEVHKVLKEKLTINGIDIPFEFAIYSNDLATPIQTMAFKKKKGNYFSIPFFINREGDSNYDLLVNFPSKKHFLLSSIIRLMVLSFAFIFIILLVFFYALYQLFKQKQISAIKTDFINNMTHEFKTPIATINLALDTLKNDKIKNNAEKVSRYLKIIRDENKRMHAQVESVLRIAKLEKNELDISKEGVSVHDILHDALMHIELLVNDRNGKLDYEFRAQRDEILGNEFHLVNVMMNILDNAIKYSPDSPEIKITTENANNTIMIKISDKGAGMSKAVVKKIFDKFYREHGGNVHNVKGHGLGLAYVKKIIDNHQGTIFVDSEKGKGSTFTIKLPLI